MRRLIVFAVLNLAAVPFALAQDAAPDINCWDHSFAYTQAMVSADSGQSNLLHVTLQSEQQGLFKELAAGPIAPWGQSNVSFYIAKSNCQLGSDGLTIQCETHAGDLVFGYDESEESRRILTEDIGDLKFSGRIQNNTYLVDVQFVKLGQTTSAAVHLNFRLYDGKCDGFHH